MTTITFPRPTPALLSMNDIPARNRPRASRGVPAATFARLTAIETDECIPWPHARHPRGYGSLAVDGTIRQVHVLACELHHGPRPHGMEAAHSCGVPSCLNYRHLRWATQSENMADRVTHGASNRGERCGAHRLTAKDVLDVRRRGGWRRDAGRSGWIAERSPGHCSSHYRRQIVGVAMTTISFPRPTLKLLSMNDRDHWRRRASDVKGWRDAACVAARNWRTPIIGFRLPNQWASTVVVTLDVADRRRRDPANYFATVKPIVDGLVDAGLWPDDTPEYVTVVEPVLRVTKDRPLMVTVELRPR